MPSIRLIAGLGNPGKQYEATRHNAGFWLLERFAIARGIALKKDNHYQALIGRDAGGAWLVLPQTFMNASGGAVQLLAGFFKIPASEILVVHDELDFPPGVARIKQGGGIAGHNGLRDISQRLATHDYWRLRLGVGRPADAGAAADYVLQKPPREEREQIDAAIGRAMELLPLALEGDLQTAMLKLHTQDKPESRNPAAEKPPRRKAEAATNDTGAPDAAPAKADPPAAPKEEAGGALKGLTGRRK